MELKKCHIWIFCGEKLFKDGMLSLFLYAVGICTEYKLQNKHEVVMEKKEYGRNWRKLVQFCGLHSRTVSFVTFGWER